MKILTVIGDSLAAVRRESNITIKDLYSYKLQERFFNKIYVVNRAVAGNTVVKQASPEAFISDIASACSSFFVIQLGICDCAPRIFTASDRAFWDYLSKMRIVGRLARFYIRRQQKKRYELTEKKEIVYTSPEEFISGARSIIEKICENNPVERVLVINIAAPGPSMIAKSFGIERNINKYNKLLSQLVDERSDICELIDIYSHTLAHPEQILSDGHHLSVVAHEWIAGQIAKRVEGLLL